MRLITILNRVVNYKRFVVKTARIVERDGEESEIEFDIVARKNSKPVCSGCGSDGAIYDHQAERRFQFVPLWGTCPNHQPPTNFYEEATFLECDKSVVYSFLKVQVGLTVT